METFEIEYKGTKLTVRKTETGEYYIQLPSRSGDRGATYYESIIGGKDGWVFSSNESDNPEYFFTAILKDDGTMQYKDDLTHGLKTISEKFDPRFPSYTAGVLEDTFTQIYDIRELVNTYEKLGISPQEIINLRRDRFQTSLKLLGVYGSGKIEDTSYWGLKRIGDQLTDYENLAEYVSLDSNGEPVVNIPADMTKEKFQAMVSRVKAGLDSDKSFMKTQDEQLSAQRAFLPDYCTKMSRRVPDSDWQFYISVVKRTVGLLTVLNADLCPKEVQEKLSGVSGIMLEDKISELIDNNSDFNKASRIENRFIIREANRFIENIDDTLGEDERVRQAVGTELLNRRSEVEKTKAERIQNETVHENLERSLRSRKPIRDEDINKKEQEAASLDDD